MTAIQTLFFFFGAAFLTLARVNGAPAKYDQRQEGDFNLHAQLENFLFVVVIPSSSSNNDLFSDLALQALELKQQLSSRSSSPKQQESIKPAEEVRDEKPYSLEVVRISEDHPDKGSSGNSTQKDEEASNILNLQSASAIDNAQNDGARDVERAAKSVKAFELPKKREMPTILGYFVDTKSVLAESKTEDSGRIRNVLENVWNPDVDAAKPGTSLKKQLFQKREEDIAPSSLNVYKNDMGLIAEKKQQELRLLGDAIENCGPGRRRDAAGICQFDESADSLL